MLDQLAGSYAQVRFLLKDVVQTKELALRLGRLPDEVVVRRREPARRRDIVLLFARQLLVLLVFQTVIECDVYLQEAYCLRKWLPLVR